MQSTLPADTKRIASIDLLRGIVMIIMALDHTRDFFHIGALTGDPLDLSTTTPVLYFTRWITHFCAPTFVFLSGVSAWLQSRRKTTGELSRFLITRGFWLIFVELTLISLGITLDIHFGIFVMQTIWAIGVSMVLLGLLVWLPYRAILVIGLIIVFGHNILDGFEAMRKGDVPVIWHFLHLPTVLSLSSDHKLGVFYPFLPWTGLMTVGYCAGKIFTNPEPARRKKMLLSLGLGCLLLFILLRATNLYGDPGPWSQQKDLLYSFLAFMDVQKYPPSLLYMCITIGPGLLLLSWVKRTDSKIAKVIIVYGRVPFFYYILHFYLLDLIKVITWTASGHSFADGMKGFPGLPFKFTVPGEGYSLGIVYLIWIAVVIALYPVCKWYDRYKTLHRESWWLSYL